MTQHTTLSDAEMFAAQVVLITLLARHIIVFVVTEVCDTVREIIEIIRKFKQ